MNDFYDYQGNNINEFIRNYRETLQGQRDSAVKQLNQQRRNDYASLMGAANRRGMLYSNFPQREKTKYNASTYVPSYTKVESSYQTALDSLRDNAVKLWNNIKYYNELTSDLNTYGLGSSSTTTN